MLNFELARVTQLDRERDIERALRLRLLRSTQRDERVAESPRRDASPASVPAPKLAASGPR
jgi:hypothetical protein